MCRVRPRRRPRTFAGVGLGVGPSDAPGRGRRAGFLDGNGLHEVYTTSARSHDSLRHLVAAASSLPPSFLPFPRGAKIFGCREEEIHASDSHT